MKKINIINIIILITIISFQVKGQQFANFNIYDNNRILLNPANTGDHDQTIAFLNSRNQWASIGGTPRTFAFGIHGQVKDNMGIGGYLVTENTGVLNMMAVNLNYAYTIKLMEDHNLTFGLGGNIFQNKIDYNEVVVNDLDDDILKNYSSNGMTFDFSFGLRYAFKALEAGVSFSQIAGSEIKHNGNNNDLTYDLLGKTNVYVSYNFEINEKFDIEPMVVFRDAPYIPAQLDVNVFNTWNDLIWLGIGYRNSGKSWLEDENGGAERDFDLSLDYSYLLLSGGVILNDNLMLGYGYEVSNSELYKQSNGTHEIALTYYFNRGERKDNDKMLELITRNQKELNEKYDEIEQKVDSNNIKSGEISEEIDEQKLAIEELDKKISELKSKEPVEEKVEEKVEEIVEEKVVEEKTVTEVVKTTTSIEKQNVVYFATGSSYLNLDAKKELREILVYLIQNPNAKINIVGHADDVGSKEQNMRLSSARAKAVADYFANNTISKDRITTEAKGFSKPLVPNNTSETRSINRRAEIQIIE